MRLPFALRTILVTFLAAHLSLVLPSVATAQTSYQQGQVPQMPPLIQKVGEGNQYYLGQANELLIRVNVWGKVQRPGQYFVPATTDLITLLSVAGGPVARSRLADVRVVRSNQTGQSETIIVNVRKFLKTGDKRLIPDLKPEDTVVVNGSFWQIVADIALVASQLGEVATVYYFFFVAGK